MTDRVDKSTRSLMMAAVRAKDTKPELSLRKLVYALGFRYRLHSRELPGKPDLAFRSKRKVIFVNGCFWHCHSGCSKASIPKTRTEFWQQKLNANSERDKQVLCELQKKGWTALVVWQCELKDIDSLTARL